MSRLRPALVPCVLGLLAAAPSAGAAERLEVRGHGWGHGVGMSQWGAYGFATRGTGYREILRHYYTGVAVTKAPAQRVGVLLATGRRSVSFTGLRAGGGRRLDPDRTYVVGVSGVGGIALRTTAGRVLARSSAPIRVSGGGQPVTVRGKVDPDVTNGRYRGAVVVRPTAIGTLNVVNELSSETYLRGVVANESPASWPADALRAQAVAARTYTVTTTRSLASEGFTHYADVRSQVYRGLRSEAASTDAAIRATRGEIITYQGRPAAAYYFSTSGGRTENVENSFGGQPLPWLKSVDDPYDGASPKHTWGPVRFSMAAATKRLRGVVKGTFRGVRVLKRGASPRIVTAEVVGSRGVTQVSGATLRERFGLNDTWATFRVTGRSDGDGDAPAPTTTSASPPAAIAPGATEGGVAPG